jgi:arsenical pump membrane protein
VLVRGLDHTGVLAGLARLLQVEMQRSQAAAGWGTGVFTALACNLVNNLPVALVAGNTLRATAAAPPLSSVMLIGVDLGPNLSVTGSLATILWMVALRREQQHISAGQFMRLGVLVMLPALLLALAAAIYLRPL